MRCTPSQGQYDYSCLTCETATTDKQKGRLPKEWAEESQHPYGMPSFFCGLSPGLKKCPPDTFLSCFARPHSFLCAIALIGLGKKLSNINGFTKCLTAFFPLIRYSYCSFAPFSCFAFTVLIEDIRMRLTSVHCANRLLSL